MFNKSLEKRELHALWKTARVIPIFKEGVIFVDLKKAFDTVDHKILIQKLAHYGIRSSELAWFKSYLSNRSQFTRVNGVDSKVQNIGIGVPKARVLVLYYFYFTSIIFPKPLSTSMSTCMQMTLA